MQIISLIRSCFVKQRVTVICVRDFNRNRYRASDEMHLWRSELDDFYNIHGMKIPSSSEFWLWITRTLNCIPTTIWSMRVKYVIYKNSLPFSQKTHPSSVAKIKNLILVRKIYSVYLENHRKYTNTVREKIKGFWILSRVEYIFTTLLWEAE